MRYFIHFSYDGRRYHGWQLQPNAVTVQAEIDRALTTLLRHDVGTTGAGRTDAGVSARQMVAHFDVPQPVADEAQLVYKLNRLLPPDIAVQAVRRVADTAHARFDATARTYHYFLHTGKEPFRRNHSLQFNTPLDFALMNAAAQRLLAVADFTSFSKVNTDVKTNICRVSRALWTEIEPGQWRFEITADRFLRNMVRAIVGTLLEVGRGRLTLEQFDAVIARKDRCAAADSVPAHALFLVSVQYPY